jgi:hypothetical protein
MLGLAVIRLRSRRRSATVRSCTGQALGNWVIWQADRNDRFPPAPAVGAGSGCSRIPPKAAIAVTTGMSSRIRPFAPIQTDPLPIGPPVGVLGYFHGRHIDLVLRVFVPLW